jgi:serine/threonine protein phosphatase PrpC
VKLLGAITEGSGPVNEDGFCTIGPTNDISAAWIFDGVTGINDRNYLPAGSDAQWLVAKANEHLLKLAVSDEPLSKILSHLVDALITDWNEISSSLKLPKDYDPPAACLTMVKRYTSGWQALRLGDSCLMAQYADGGQQILIASPNNVFDHWLADEARKRRAEGQFDVKSLLAEFRPQLMASRKTRNTSEGFGILNANRAANRFAELLDLDMPEKILLCTDGFYRVVDHYDLYDDNALLSTCRNQDGVAKVLKELRTVEAADLWCEKFIRFKPADDATVVALEKIAPSRNVSAVLRGMTAT